MFREGTALEALESVDSRRFLPHALLATLAVIVAPAGVVVALSPLSGIADLLVSALLATGLSVAAGSACAALWTRLPQSREIPFGDLMLWAWARRVRAERRLAKVAAGGAPLGEDGELAGLRTLAVVFEARDGFSHGHSGRVARHAERIARRMGLPDEEVERIEAAAAVHDVGMVSVPAAILVADGDQLSAEERPMVERHVEDGAARVAKAGAPAIAELIRHHHERVDGGGYPNGLAGDEIPLGARIIAVADRFDELVAPAPGRRPARRRNVLDELSERAGTELDAAVVAAFAGYYSGTRSIAGVALAATAPQRAVRWIAAAPATIGSAVGGPALVQGVCAAGTLAVAGACLGGLSATTPDSDGSRAAAQQTQQQPRAADRQLAAAATGPRSDARGRQRPARRARGRDKGSHAPPAGAPDTPSGGGGGTPPPRGPQTGGGGTSPVGGGGAERGGGGSAPGPATQPVAPVQAPPVQAPQTSSNPASQVLDPVLDGVSDLVPPAKPVTDVVKGVVGGLAGGLLGGGQR